VASVARNRSEDGVRRVRFQIQMGMGVVWVWVV
jgi:hypothetical protein